MSSCSNGIWPAGRLPCWSYSWLMLRRRPRVSKTSMDQPEPWMPLAAALNCFWKPSKPPKYSLMAAASSPSGRPPPSGDMFFQKVEWLMCPPKWKARSFSNLLMAPKLPDSRASASCSRAAFAPAT